MKDQHIGLFNVTGEWKDVIRHSDGTIEETSWSHNLVVKSITTLIASLIGGQGVLGDIYWAVGSGDPDWDTNPVDPTLEETQLTNEIGRKRIFTNTNVEFYDETNNHSDDPTNKLHITTIFEEQDCNGDWREFGLFAGESVSIMMNTGTMIDKKHHGVIAKTVDTTVERHLILTFNISEVEPE